MEICAPYDIIIDGTDNFPTRYLVNDVCVLQKKPNVYGSIFRFEGQATVFATDGGPCYRCLYPGRHLLAWFRAAQKGGVLGILPGTIGLIQATEAIKLILEVGEPLIGRSGSVRCSRNEVPRAKAAAQSECRCAADHPTITQLIL